MCQCERSGQVPASGRADGDLQRAYTADLEAATRASINLDPTPYFAKYGPQGNSWAIFALLRSGQHPPLRVGMRGV
ncbi:hypothetical protein [Kitasatospora sp. NPDC098663]|uniref:hypothetical protein n=1 Tax=Kitasatospora sp. NPDC098663 TaxID=3364096 RepID=UPI0037F25BCC